MPDIDFVISNGGHHAAMMRPVVAALAERPDFRCRVISLCEFRGIKSPVRQFDLPGVHFVKILPGRFRSASSGGSSSGSTGPSRLRRLARWLSWYGLLKRPLQRAWAARPDLVLLPNDAAFPYSLIVSQLHALRIPFVLFQEGIRFELPARGEPVYGQGGAAAVAAWGENSAAYFKDQGVPPDRILLTGSPRFDHLAQTDWSVQASKLKEKLGLTEGFLLLLSNPIDDQGFCTRSEKLALIGRFIEALGPLFEQSDLYLVIKLHGRESRAEFAALVASTPFAGRITVLQDEPLYPLFTLARAAVVLASTVGLEALMFDLPLGVLELPGAGFVFDYVSSGAALGLTWREPMVEQVQKLLKQPETARRQGRAYVTRNLAVQQDSVTEIVRLVDRQLENKEAQVGN